MEAKVKKAPKFYQYKIDWVEITPEIKKKLFDKQLGNRQYTEIGMTCNYSAEYFRQLFNAPPEKLNKIVYDAIVAYLGTKINDLTTPSKGKTKDLNEKKTTNYAVDSKGGGKKESDYMASRRKSKQ